MIMSRPFKPCFSSNDSIAETLAFMFSIKFEKFAVLPAINAKDKALSSIWSIVKMTSLIEALDCMNSPGSRFTEVGLKVSLGENWDGLKGASVCLLLQQPMNYYETLDK